MFADCCRDACIAIGLFCCSTALCADPPPNWIDPQGIAGKLMICGGGKLPAPIVNRFVGFAGGTQARIVVIPTATSTVDEAKKQEILESWADHKVASVQVLHTRLREQANSEAFVAPLKQATGVWISGGSQSRIAEAYVGTAVERELYELLKRDGIIGGTSAGAAIQSKLMIASGTTEAVLKTGFDLLPDCVIDQHFRQRKRQQRLTKVIATHPSHVGIGIDESTAVLVTGRDISVIGKNKVTVYLAAGKNRDALNFELEQGDAADLTALRRASRDRAGPAFPPKEMKAPNVPKGALVLAGGGNLPSEIVEKFIDLAGGPDSLIVVLPTAQADPLSDVSSSTKMLRSNGATNVVELKQRTRQEVESDEFIGAIKEAGGVWFGGGRQWRFVDAYEGTKAYIALHNVLRRGGVIGGSSAGASIQGEYLCRGSPLGNREIMAEGYERGFNFLPGTAIDQHFTKRNRGADMKKLIERYPQLVGIGIDESTAIVVQDAKVEVLGRGRIHRFSWNCSDDSCSVTVDSFNSGSKTLLDR